MDHTSPSAPVVVGIDGSKAALRAALWAVDEAVSRDTPLRLVQVAPASGHGLDEALAEARDVLHRAWTEVEATGKPVKIESDIVRGESVSRVAWNLGDDPSWTLGGGTDAFGAGVGVSLESGDELGHLLVALDAAE